MSLTKLLSERIRARGLHRRDQEGCPCPSSKILHHRNRNRACWLARAAESVDVKVWAVRDLASLPKHFCQVEQHIANITLVEVFVDEIAQLEIGDWFRYIRWHSSWLRSSPTRLQYAKHFLQRYIRRKLAHCPLDEPYQQTLIFCFRDDLVPIVYGVVTKRHIGRVDARIDGDAQGACPIQIQLRQRVA